MDAIGVGKASSAHLGECSWSAPSIGFVATLAIAATLNAYAAAEATTTAQYLEAPRVRSQLNVSWASSKKVFVWDIPAQNPATGTIGPDSVFVASRAVSITYPRLNPLKVQATASATAVDDPAHSTVTI